MSAWLLVPRLPESLRALGDDEFLPALTGMISLAQLLVAAWVLGVVAASVFGPSRLPRLLAPRSLRRALFAGAVGALAISPAVADPGAAPDQAVPAVTHDLAGLRLPDRPTAAPLDETPPALVVVQPGDTLWAIAARALPRGSDDTEIAAACARWYAANRAVIGPDPDLILPAQRLVPPGDDRS